MMCSGLNWLDVLCNCCINRIVLNFNIIFLDIKHLYRSFLFVSWFFVKQKTGKVRKERENTNKQIINK
jgi:hypothetical protein